MIESDLPDDPLIVDPPQVGPNRDWKNGHLIVELTRNVTADWLNVFRKINYRHASHHLATPDRIQFTDAQTAFIPSPENTVAEVFVIFVGLLMWPTRIMLISSEDEYRRKNKRDANNSNKRLKPRNNANECWTN